MAETKQDAVKLLSDDEVAVIAAKKYLHAGQRDVTVAMDEARNDIDSLCATVRALRVVHVCGAVASGSAVGGCGNEVTTLEDFRCADCLAWFHRDCINEHFQLDAYVKKLRELREQGAIDDWKKSLADKEAENTALREQLAQKDMEISSRLADIDTLQAQLAQVTRERDRLQEQLNTEQALDIIAPRTLTKEVSDAIEELK